MKKICSVLVVFVIIASLLLSCLNVHGVQAQTSSIWSTQTVQHVNISGGFAQVVALDSNGYPQIMYSEGSSHTLFYARWTGSSWNIESVASNAGTAISFVLDSNDKPYVVFNTVSFVGLKYAKLEGTNWIIQTLDFASGVNSIALDTSGNPCVAYVDFNTGTLKYARWSGSAWSISTVDASGNVAFSVSLVLKSVDIPCIAYSYLYHRGPDRMSLKYATLSGSNWVIETVDETEGLMGGTCSIALNAGNPCISYADQTYLDLKYAVKSGPNSWNLQVVDSVGNVGSFSSLAIGKDNLPQISYVDIGYTILKYAKFDGLTWHIQVVDSQGGDGTSLALDSKDNPYISYCDIRQSELKYAKFSGGSIEVVDSMSSSFFYTSLVLDSSQNPHISYASSSGHLAYASLQGSTWTTEDVDDSASYVGQFSSLAFDNNGYPHISYYDGFKSDLKYAYYDGSNWHVEVVDDGGLGGAGGPTSLALDSEGNPHIAYYDWNREWLKYASWTSSDGWVFVPVDATGGAWPSLELDRNGVPSISYYKPSSAHLNYATFDGSAWTTPETVDSSTLVGAYSSLAFDSNNNPHISYFDEVNGDLKYAARAGGVWSSQVVDATGKSGDKGTSLVLDSNNYPIISYLNGAFNLAVARWIGSGWSFQTIDPGLYAGEWSSMVLDSSGNPHISYYDDTNIYDSVGNLNYAHFVFGAIPGTVQYTVSFAMGNGGSIISPTTGSYTYVAGTSVPISVSAVSGYQFTSWSSSTGLITFGSTTSASTTATINGPGTITANFAADTVQYSVDFVLGDNGATITPAAGEHTYNSGDVVSISATANSGYHFSSWTSTTTSITFGNANSASTTATIGAAGTVNANFEDDTVLYSVDFVLGVGGASISPYGSNTYEAGNSVPILATAVSGYHFTSWSSSTGLITFGSTTSASTTATINGPGTITANFAADTVQYSVDFVLGDGGSTINPMGSHTYVAGTSIQIFASASPGYHFTSWSSNTGSIVFENAEDDFAFATINADGTIIANFEVDPVLYSVDFVLGVGGASISPYGSNTYEAGNSVPILATAVSGYHFTSWSSSSGLITFGSTTSASTTATINGPGTITANFAADTGSYTLAFKETGLSFGKLWSVTCNGVTKSSTSSTISFSNIPSGNYPWSVGSPISGGTGTQFDATQASGVINVPSKLIQNIVFNKQYYLTMDSNFGTTSPSSGGWFNAGSKVTIKAIAPSTIAGERYLWNGWLGSGSRSYSGSMNPASNTVIMNGPIKECALWSHQYLLTIMTSGVPSPYSADVSLGANNKGHTSDASPFTTWVTAGTSTGKIYIECLIYAGSNTRYIFGSWSDASTANPKSSIVINGPTTFTANYKTQFKVTFTQSGLGSESKGTVVKIDGANYARSDLPVSFWWEKGSSHLYQYLSPLKLGSTSYIWKSTNGLSILQSGTITILASGTISGNYIRK